MNSENTLILFNTFPELYAGRHESIKENLMPFGFECPDDWFWIIYNLSQDITNYCKQNKIRVPKATQVKEKYGSLRFYIDFGDDRIYELIDKAEASTEYK